MGSLKVVIKENNIPDNAKAIGEDGKLIGITEVAIDIHLLCIRAGGGAGGHKAIGHEVRVCIRVIFIVGFEGLNEEIEGFGVVFPDIKFNAGGIKGEDAGKGGINELAEWFCKIGHLPEHKLNVRFKVLAEPGKKGSVRDFREATEVPEFPAKGEEEDEKGVGRDGKDLLQDKGRKEAGERINAFSAKMLVKSIGKNRRDELLDIKMFVKELEKGRGIIHEHLLAVRKDIFKRKLTVFSSHKFSPPFVSKVFVGTYISP